jgi:hypothetical protein
VEDQPSPLDLEVVDALARLQLAARRAGRSIRLVHPSQELRDLLDFAGLADVVPSALEPVGETESGEELWIKEVVEPGDPSL